MKNKVDLKKIDEAIEPGKVLNCFMKWFDGDKKLAFFVALFVGIITHIQMLTDIIFSQDGIWNSMSYFRPGVWEVSLGRWGLELVGRLNSFLAIPSLATISCILCMAIGALFVVDLFEIKNKVGIIFTSSAIVVAPTLLVTLLYVYTSFAYCFCFMISVIAVWLVYKCGTLPRLSLVCAAVLFMLSLSIYQSYIGVTIALCIMKSIVDLAKEDKETKDILIHILKTICVVVAGGILYYIVSMILIKVNGIDGLMYKAEGVSLVSIICGIPSGIIQSYKDFAAYFFRDRILSNTNFRREVLYLIMFIVLGIALLIRFIKCEGKDKKDILIKRVLMVALLLVLPIGLNFVNILVAGNELYVLSAYQMILVIPFAVAVMEGGRIFNFGKWVFVVVLFGILATYFITDMASYAALKLTYNQAYSTTVRILDRIENTPGYEKDMPIAFIGIIGDNNYPRTNNLYNFTIGTMINNPVFHYSYSGMMGTWQNYLRIFFGIEIKIPTEREYTAIIDSHYFREEAEVFPSQKSVYVQDGFVVVKLDENPPVAF